jgi:hypothetical protein
LKVPHHEAHADTAEWERRAVMTGNRHVRFGGGRLETQVRLCADRLPYFILGFAGPKSEANAIKEAIGEFLGEHLHLEMSASKTLITHTRTQQACFLGYAISVYHADDKLSDKANTRTKARSINGRVRLGIPNGLVREYVHQYQHKGKTQAEKWLLGYSDAHIILAFQLRYRGLAEYYKYAVDRRRMSSLKNVMEISLVKTLVTCPQIIYQSQC